MYELEEVALELDVYSPDNDSANRPVFMFIHGGGFTGGTRTNPEIVEIAEFYASRGWVFVSVDYRTTEELGKLENMDEDGVLEYYRGIAPAEWVQHAIDSVASGNNAAGASSTAHIQQATAMYAAQRDAKAALRWIIANASTYGINPDFVTVGGNSAGAITTVALGISDEDDFRDEISIEDDPTLESTHLDVSTRVQTMVYFWGSNIKVELYGDVYEVDLYDSDDPDLFMAHGTAEVDTNTPFTGAEELQSICDSEGIYSELVPLVDEHHGAWTATVDGMSLSELSFDFIVDRQDLRVK